MKLTINLDDGEEVLRPKMNSLQLGYLVEIMADICVALNVSVHKAVDIEAMLYEAVKHTGVDKEDLNVDFWDCVAKKAIERARDEDAGSGEGGKGGGEHG